MISNFHCSRRLLLAGVVFAAMVQGVLAALPAGWTDTDIGSPGDAGSASYDGTTWTVSGGGSDIYGNADQFNFVSEPYTSDGAISAQVTSIQNSDPSSGWSKAGLMFRNDTSAGAPYALVIITAGNGANFQYRQTQNGPAVNDQITGITAPVWLKLVRAGDNFSGYYSVDDVNWVLIGASGPLALNGSVLAGLAVTAHNNSALNTSTFRSVNLTPPCFGVYRELWTNLNANVGNSLTALTNTTYNPNWPNNPVASFTHIFTNFETELDTGMNYYGQRVRGFVVPPTNGPYQFWISSDDQSVLYLSTNENASAKTQIATAPYAVGFEQWYSIPAQQSALINLQAGCRYYIEAQMQQGQGGDHLSVGWELPNGILEQPMSTPSVAGTLLIPYNGVDVRPGIFAQSSATNVLENLPVTFTVLSTNESSLSYQWYVGGQKLSGATLPFFTLSNASLALNNQQIYTCSISNTAGAVTSAPITLTVLRDTTPPAVSAIYNLGLTNVQVVFSKAVASATAANLSNYTFTNGTAVTAATLASDNVTLTLTTAPLVYGSNYSIVINGIYDTVSTPNEIAPNTAASFLAAPYVDDDIGGAAIASTTTVSSNGISITSAGNDIGGTGDQFNFQYELVTGNFDVNICLAGLSLSDLWAKAGLMARATLNPSSAFAASLATPGLNGCFFEDRASTEASAMSTGTFPVNFPNTWLRLARSGNVFTGYASYDGQTWTQLGAITLALPSQIYLGLAVSSHNVSQPVAAQFLNLSNTVNATLGASTNPHEPLAASSRRTCMTISEIMYKPAPRTDGNNTEFVELYNSAPWFHDISGYQLTCADMNYTFPSGTIVPGGGFLVVAASPSGIANVYGITNVMGPYNGSLKHAETLQLFDEQTNLLLTVPYTDVYPWPVAAEGTGHSIVLANPSYGEGNPRAWDISDVIGGSPGVLDSYHPSPLRNVVINEWLAHSENPAVMQFVELYNHSNQTNDLSGCILTDDPTTNKFVMPAGTLIGPDGFLSFDQTQLGFLLNAAGGTLYFIKPDGSRVLDAVPITPQMDGVSSGRWPNGANDIYPLATPTPGATNSGIAIGNIVINELMYDPISESDGDQYIELYNQGTNAVSLANWQFTAGVTYTFPTNASIAAGGYVVVGSDVANLLSKYTNLNSGNTFGNFTGKLSHNGERVALAMPESLFDTNTIYVVEDEVTYGVGGRWGEWSGGGGSSLELIDPHSNHRLAANWADSDETKKSTWVDIETTGVLDNGNNYESGIDHAQIGVLDVGECLVDNIEVDYNGVNYVSNGTFESGAGLNNWSLQGDHSRSSLESSGYQSSFSLHMRCSDRVWTGDNSCQVSLNANTLAQGQTATLRFKARWLHGWPEALLRLNGNWLEAAGVMPVPNNLGTPGAPNSAYITNAGPAVYDVTHFPTVPLANQSAAVHLRVHDPDGVRNLNLNYRIDPSTTYISVPMRDDGSGADALGSDGIYSAYIPAQPANTIVAYYISATDSVGKSTRFPALRPNDNEPPRECVVMFGDSNPNGSFSVYHMWITQTNITRWANLSDLSNEENDFTFVNGSRVIYNVGGRFAGSPYHQDFDVPNGSLCHYKWEFPDDDMFLGQTDFNKIHEPGNGPGDDASIQREQIANTFLRALGVPWLNRRYVAVFVNGNRRGTLMEDAQVPGSDIIKEHFPNDSGGFLYKMQPWFEMAPFPSGSTIGFDNQSWCEIDPFLTTGGVKKVSRYRWNFEIRHTPTTCLDFTNVFSLVDAASSSSSPNYVANMENMVNMENWMRVFAANHAAGNWDSFGAPNGQNLYGYIGTINTKYTLMMWDFNIVLGNSGSWAPGQNLLSYNTGDANLAAIYACPTFLRMYWRAMGELVNGPLNPAVSGLLATAKYNAFTENGLNVENPAVNILPWLSQAQSSVASQLSAVNASSFTVNPGVTMSNDVAYVTGVAPVAVAMVWINGEAVPVTWTSFTTWQASVPVHAGTNTLNITGVDRHGELIAGDTGTVSAVYNGIIPAASGQVVINEIMYNPLLPNAQYIELYNNSSAISFDLSGWQLPGLSYTFAQGASIAPHGYLVLAANITAFAGAYGATIPVFDTFTGTLPTNGPTTLTLLDSNNVVVTEVQYDSAAPWPQTAATGDSSLQLIDPTQDNWREGNWSTTTSPRAFSPGAVNTVEKSLPAFPELWINEVQADDITGITNAAGQHVPWIELYNPGNSTISLSGLYLSDNYANLTEWAFPSGASISPGQFKVIFADGQTGLNTLSEIHTSFTLPNGAGAVALSRVYNSQQQIVDYLNYTNLPPNYSFGSFPDGQSFVRQQFLYATPGATNDGGTPEAVPYFNLGSVYTQNFDSLPDPGATTVNSGNPVTINGVNYAPANPLDFAASTPGGLDLPNAMAGWHGLAGIAMKLGASDGDQSTGGIISFGPTTSDSTNRALGLLATSSTGPTAFAVSFINETPTTLNQINVNFTGELWRQQPAAKFLSCSYYVDLTGTNGFTTAATTPLSNLDVSFPTGPLDPEDGTQPANQIQLGVTNQSITDWPPGATLWVVWQMTNNAGNSQGLAIDNLSFSAGSTYVPPSIVTQPASQTVNSGNNPVFSVVASSLFPITYQWQENGAPLSGQTNATLALNDVGAGDQASYSVLVSNLYGATLSSNAVLTVNSVTGLPVINPAPQGQTQPVGGTANFFISASGNPPLSYQWQFNNGNINGATNFTLTVSNLTSANQGNYSVQVTDDAGTVSSSSAYLTVLSTPPSIVTQPISQTLGVGATATLSVTAAGSAPLAYQWFQGATPLTDGGAYRGTGTSTLTIQPFEVAQNGSYTVVVTNTGGAITSAPAALNLATPSYVAYTNPGAIYSQNFDALPDPGATSVNANNAVTISGITYSLPNPMDFAYPIAATGAGGLGLATNMPGWYGIAATAIKFGASAGDQTTGGIISFGATAGTTTNRSLGLLATSTTGPTAFAVRILNQSPDTLTNMNVSFTGELWRQQTAAKSLTFSYYVDPSGTNTLNVNNITAALPALNVNFATGALAAGNNGPVMTAPLSVANQAITNCPPGAALWLMWQMSSATGSSQGLGIDNFSFSATGLETLPILSIAQSSTSITVSWPPGATGYTLQFNTNGLAYTNDWQTILSTNTGPITIPLGNSNEFFRLKH